MAAKSSYKRHEQAAAIYQFKKLQLNFYISLYMFPTLFGRVL